MKNFKEVLVNHLRKLEQSSEPRKETMYRVTIDDDKSIWLLEEDLVYVACSVNNIESTKDLIFWYNLYNIDVEVPKSMEDDLTHLIRYRQGKDKQ